jgi:hypothetical protein
MDILRLLLCVGLAVLLWRLRIGRREPIREFFLWGVDYPFHFLLTATLVLVVWGVIGSGFGIEGLFLDEDPLTQVLLGATVMLLLATITVHYVTLGTSRHGWWTALADVAGFLRGLNAVAERSRPVQTTLVNGFLETLTTADIRGLDRAARRHAEALRDHDIAAARSGPPDLLEGEAFRLLIAPAVLLEKGVGLVVLVGLVPTFVIPLVRRDPQAILERVPWFVGTCLGAALAVVLGCWTTAWAAAAAGWDERVRDLRGAIVACRLGGNFSAWSTDAPRPGTNHEGTHESPLWLPWLAAFFAVHAAVTLLLPARITSLWIDWPDAGAPVGSATRVPWLPLGILLGEALAASLVALGLTAVRRVLSPQRRAEVFTRVRSIRTAVVTFVIRTIRARWVRRAAWIAAVVLAATSLAVTLAMAPESTRSIWTGLRGYTSLGAMLCCWLAIFWLSTHAAIGHGARTLREQQAAVAAVCGLVALHVFSAPVWLVAPLAAVAAVLSGSRTLAALWQGVPYGVLRVTCGVGLAVAAAGSLAWSLAAGAFGVVAAVWLGLALLSLGSTTLGWIATRKPAALYPFTVLLGYFAFAVPYSALSEARQSAMPAAGSIAIAFALAAAVSTSVALARPKSALLSMVALVAVAILLNGAVLFVSPNEFKGSFPGMGPYYGLPVYLDSRDYFRDTTPSTSQLRSRAVTEDFDRLSRQRGSERLATVYFTMGPLRDRPDGSHAVSLTVEDPRGRLRAVVGDTLRLTAEEWFTIRLHGDDLVALAEEPFYRRIFRWFRYETLHMVRHGIFRGPAHVLAHADEPTPSVQVGRPSPVPYRFITGRDVPEGPGADELLGLRIEGLAAEYQSFAAEYAIIAMNWRGVVTAARHDPDHDEYTVEFEVPQNNARLDARQLRTMQSWLERCHLDTLRPAVPALPHDEAGAERVRLMMAASARSGECLALEDARGEAAVPVGVFFATAPETSGLDPTFAAHLPTRDAIEATIHATPPPARGASDDGVSARDRFTLRPAHDRGLFVVPGADDTARSSLVSGGTGVTVALYNAGRLRPGDRVIMTWNGREGTASGPGLTKGRVFEIVSIGEQVPRGATSPPTRGAPAGAVWASLVPVGPGTQAGDARTPDGAAVPTGSGQAVGQWQTVGLLNNTEVLLAWRGLVGDRWHERKPKLVIVTVSGGGIRASVWTAVVLRKLEATLGGDFPYHVRLVTGASGGMVGGSYYATSLAPPSPAALRGGRQDFGAMHGMSVEEFVDRMATDQLDSVAGRMLFADLPGTFSPFVKRGDRGRTLEETWIRWTGGRDSPLGRPLQSYAADERLGWRPSLVFTPMMVEDGRRLLISNLDLAFATRNVGGLLIEPSSRKIERPAIQGGDFDESIHEEDDVFSLSAVEFFRLFPEAHDFRVTTAIRMSASFPWVSPAVNLPTLPPRRVVDAAYYDNYGVNLSALWLSKMSDWLEANTSGVLVVQIRDNVSQGARTEIDFDRAGPEDAPLDRLVWHAGSRLLRPGLQAISTPLIGITNARTWTMAFRNDEQVDLQDLLFDDRRGSDFFRTVVFECPVEVSLSWKLTARERALLAGGFGRPEATPREELARVKDYMTGRDSYEFHKWRIEHRNDPDFDRTLKARYDEQLGVLGIDGVERLSVRESQRLYENVVKNLKRLELLVDWWSVGRVTE